MSVQPDLRYRSATGLRPYDTIPWSTKPTSLVLPSEHLHIRAIRHLGQPGKGSIQAGTVDDGERLDAILINRGGSGRLEVRLGGRLQSSPIRRGQISLLPAGTDAIFEFPMSNQGFTLLAPAGTMRPPNVTAAHDPMIAVRNTQAEQLLGMIERELVSPGFGSTVLVDAMVNALAIALHQIDPAAAAGASDKIHLGVARLNRVIDYVEAHLADPVSLADMANIAGLSPFHFSRVFKLTTGETPYAYLAARRLDRARLQLIDGNQPLAQIALDCGFAGQSHFTAAFRRATGMSPGRYRRLGNGFAT